MSKTERCEEALARARGGVALTNYPPIYQEFMDRGIPFEEIRPRENVLTYNAWRALGRHVRKGEHGVRITTWITRGEEKDAAGKVVKNGRRFPKTAVVFHVTQTEEDGRE